MGNFMELEEFSNKYYQHEINRKKISALINFSETMEKTSDWLAFEYISHWLDQEFLDEEGMRFLDHLLTKYGINYLDWSYKSPWVKRQIASKRSAQAAWFFEEVEDERMTRLRNLGHPSFVNRHKIIRFGEFKDEQENRQLALGFY